MSMTLFMLAVGISPNDCKETTDEDLEAIESLAKDPKVVVSR